MSRPSLVILAGGSGTRLRSVTGPDTPKPMANVFGKPFLYWLIKHYVKQGFKSVIISTGYRAEVIESYDFDADVVFVRDDETRSPFWFYNEWQTGGHWVVNGDTFIPETLPKCEDPTILCCNGTDAGAQFSTRGKIHIHKTPVFYDIGSPEGLERFKQYFAGHPLRQS